MAEYCDQMEKRFNVEYDPISQRIIVDREIELVKDEQGNGLLF